MSLWRCPKCAKVYGNVYHCPDCNIGTEYIYDHRSDSLTERTAPPPPESPDQESYWVDRVEGSRRLTKAELKDLFLRYRGDYLPSRYERVFVSAETADPPPRSADSKVDGSTSDGYHTFDELYAYRKALNALLFNEWASRDLYDVHKSTHHSDGEPCFGGGWFIVVAQTPTGQISNHYKLADWSLFRVPERERSATYDGHTPAIALERMLTMAGRETAPPTLHDRLSVLLGCSSPDGSAELGVIEEMQKELAAGRAIPAPHQESK